MFKNLILVILILLVAGCSSDATSNNMNSNGASQDDIVEKTAESTPLGKAIALARKNRDYRLLVTSGRSMTVPGVKASEYQAVIALCGKHYDAVTGDVITSEMQRSERKERIDYMRQYNEKMLVICREKVGN